ncbi:hypothetical protein ABIB38_004850, partial [Massilia sp. UYP11]|uniref:hypothetical protein n=1 Tax=Massilia sp. UYP11 TaxID=1756385 RepID=UPI003D1CFD75
FIMTALAGLVRCQDFTQPQASRPRFLEVALSNLKQLTARLIFCLVLDAPSQLHQTMVEPWLLLLMLPLELSNGLHMLLG